MLRTLSNEEIESYVKNPYKERMSILINSLYDNIDNLNKRILDYQYEIMRLRIELATLKRK